MAVSSLVCSASYFCRNWFCAELDDVNIQLAATEDWSRQSHWARMEYRVSRAVRKLSQVNKLSLGTLSIYFQSKMYVNIYWKRLPQTKHPNSLFSRQVEVSISHRVRFIERLALQAFMTFMATYTYRLNCEKLPIQSGRTQSTSRRVKDLSKMFQWSIYLRQISLVCNTEHSKATMLNAKFALFTFEWSQRPIAGDCGHLPQFHK